MTKKIISIPFETSKKRHYADSSSDKAAFTIPKKDPLGQVLTVKTVPTTIQDALLIVCFSEFVKESTPAQQMPFFERLTEYIVAKKPIVFLNGDEVWNEIDRSFLKKHMPQPVAKLWNDLGTHSRFEQFCTYESVLSHLNSTETIEIGGSYKEFCVTMCAVNICRDTIVTSMDELTLPFEASSLDEEHHYIRIPNGVISDIMSVSRAANDA